jgi:phosphopantothenoylcysteine decarboxylase/phosphopantothenate--cysteine ligase
LRAEQLLLGVTGGVAAYKAAELARELQRRGARVQVAMTEGRHPLGSRPVTFQALTGQPVFTDQWDPESTATWRTSSCRVPPTRSSLRPLRPTSWRGWLRVWPTTCCRSAPAWRATALRSSRPRWNRQMWSNPASQRNVAQLRADGIAILGPDSGAQACGETGDGRMLEPDAIAEELEAFFVPKRLAGRRVLIAAGPTFEPIDPVRGITNLSSGKQGSAIRHRPAARPVRTSCWWRVPRPCRPPAGCSGSTCRTRRRCMPPSCGKWLRTPSGQARRHQCIAATGRRLHRRGGRGRWRVANYSDHKLKKTDDASTPSLEFAQNPDILAEVAHLPSPPWCVGFAAESEDLERNGQDKRRRKGVRLLVANIGHATFGRDDNELLLIDEHGTTRLPRAGKTALARVPGRGDRLEAAGMKIELRILDERMRDAVPAYATPGSAGLDLRACVDAPVTLQPGETTMIPTGLSVHLADPATARCCCPARAWVTSSTASRRGNLVGLIDLGPTRAR